MQKDEFEKKYGKIIVPLPRPVEETIIEVCTGCKNRKIIINILSEEYVKEHVKHLNEDFINEDFNCCSKKTVFTPFSKKSNFNITVYSETPISNNVIYAIGVSYSHATNIVEKPPEREFLKCLDRFYHDFQDISSIKNRITLYSYSIDGLIIILDTEPEKLGFNPAIMSITKLFNSKDENGKYKTIIKVYVDFDIIVISSFPLSVEKVKDIAIAYRSVANCMLDGEDDVSCNEFLDALKDDEFSRKLKKYEYDYVISALLIEIE